MTVVAIAKSTITALGYGSRPTAVRLYPERAAVCVKSDCLSTRYLIRLGNVHYDRHGSTISERTPFPALQELSNGSAARSYNLSAVCSVASLQPALVAAYHDTRPCGLTAGADLVQ